MLMSGRAQITKGSFRPNPPLLGTNAISLLQVLYDRRNETVHDLPIKVHTALPPASLP
jgi:hypothetical protein